MTAREIKRRLGTGALIQEHRGVYRVGHCAPNVEARYLAAVLACGEGALLGGAAAACLLGVTKGQAPIAEVITPTERRVAGVRTRRARRLDPRDGTTWRAIPVTTVARTLVDLAAVLPGDQLARAFHNATIVHGARPDEIEDVLARRPTSRGATTMRAVLRGDSKVTLSSLERHFLRRLRQAGLPSPETNVLVDGRLVDCRWPDRRLTVELDGYRYHHTRYAWEADRERERQARARGDEFRRYTYRDVVEAPTSMLSDLARLLLTQCPAQGLSAVPAPGR